MKHISVHILPAGECKVLARSFDSGRMLRVVDVAGCNSELQNHPKLTWVMDQIKCQSSRSWGPSIYHIHGRFHRYGGHNKSYQEISLGQKTSITETKNTEI